MMGLGLIELVFLGICMLIGVAGLVIVIVMAFSTKTRAAGNLINCPDCGRGVSPQASACPNCGRPMS